MQSNWIEVVGFVAALCTAMAYLPQVYSMWRSKDGSGLSWGMISLLLVALTLWLVFGFAIHQRPVILVNGTSLILTLTMTALKIKYSSARNVTQNA